MFFIVNNCFFVGIVGILVLFVVIFVVEVVKDGIMEGIESEW